MDTLLWFFTFTQIYISYNIEKSLVSSTSLGYCVSNVYTEMLGVWCWIGEVGLVQRAEWRSLHLNVLHRTAVDWIGT